MTKVLFLQRDPTVYIGVMIISAVLKREGHQCAVLIENMEKDFMGSILHYSPDLVAFSCTTGLHRWVIETAKKIKEKIKVPIIVGGPHATFYPETIYDEGIDMVCLGEGEYAMLELVENMEKGRDITKIKNLWVKKDGKVFRNDLRPLIQNLDELPFADREIYLRYPQLKFWEHQMVFVTARGCPYNCSFCFNKSFREMYSSKGRYVRRRSVHNVISELLEVKERYDIKRIEFIEDALNLDPEWLHEFLETYEKEVKLPFLCNLRADLIDERMVRELKRSGCICAKIGIESGNSFLRNKVLKKDLSTERIRNAVHLIKKYDLKLQTYNILGIPGETIDTVFETLRINLKLKPYHAWCSIMQPYPKTELAQYATENGFLDENYSLDDLDYTFFISTPIKLKDKNKIINLQKFFDLCVKFPFLIPLVKLLIKLPPNRIFNLVFKLNYAYATLRTNRIGLTDFLRLGLYMGSYFARG